MNPLLAHVTGTGPDDWAIVAVPLVALLAITAILARPNGGTSILARIAARLEKITGIAGWAAATIGIGLGALSIAVIGFYWDVAWHIDLGRDKDIFTPAHDMILLGLLLIPVAAGAAIVLATVTKAQTRLRVGPLRVPWSSLAIGAIGIGALSGFPLDEFWHRAYGVDVTMWGPTHLMMIGGASITPIGLWLAFREAGANVEERFPRTVAVLLAGATLTGLSTFQGEFDFGVPQFQLLYHPVLVAGAAAGALSLARIVLGRWGAVKAVLGFAAIRGVVALLVGALGHTQPHFPLYLGAALAVEAVAWLVGTDDRPRFAVWSGVACATVGLATEWAWSQAWVRHPWNADVLLDGIVLAFIAAISTALLAAGLATIARGEHEPAAVPIVRRVPVGVIVASLVALAVAIALPFKRTSASDVTAAIALSHAGDTAFVDVTLSPPDAAEGAAWFEAMSWQSGTLVIAPLEETGPGTYRSSAPLPVAGKAKTLIRLHRGSEVMAVPVYMPDDPEIGASEIPAVDRTATFERDSRLLMRESRTGNPTTARIVFGTQAAILAVWIAVIGFVAWRVGRPDRMTIDRRGRGFRFATAPGA
jgi:hypothetical protein